MSGRIAIEAGVRRAVIAALTADAALGAAVNGVFEAGAPGVTAPCVMVEGLVARDWGTKTAEGREIIVTLTLHDARREGESVAALAALVAAALGGMARSGDGFAIASVRPRGCAIARRKTGAWVATMDFRLRALADQEQAE